MCRSDVIEHLNSDLAVPKIYRLPLAVRGLSNVQIAGALVVSPKTAGHHLENIHARSVLPAVWGRRFFFTQLVKT